MATTTIVGPGLQEIFDQRRVRLAELVSEVEPERPFRRMPNESLSGMRYRLYEHEQTPNSARGKVASYERAISFGAKFAPVFVFELKGTLILQDGWYRCAAAALRGHDTVSAVVFHVASAEEGECLANVLFEQQAQGKAWRESVISARVLLKTRRAAGEKAT